MNGKVPDLAQGTVLSSYTDEGLGGFFGPGRAAQLRILPPEWRQNAMAEAHQRAYELRIDYSGEMSEWVDTPRPGVTFEGALVEVIADIRAQLANA